MGNEKVRKNIMFSQQAAAYLKQIESGGVSEYISRSIETSFRRAINGIATLRRSGYPVGNIKFMCDSIGPDCENFDSFSQYRTKWSLDIEDSIAIIDVLREYWNGNSFVRKALSCPD